MQEHPQQTKFQFDLKTQIMKYLIHLFLLLFVSSLFAQEDLLADLAKEDKTTNPVFATFKGQRIVSSQTNEQLKKEHLNVNILHRFGTINTGIENLFGVDQAFMRFVLEYGITDKLQISLGRSNISKMYDLGFKAKLIEQRTGYKPFPLSISYYGNMGVNTSISKIYDYAGIAGKAFGRLNFTHQLLFTQKINEKFSWLIAPTAVYYNIVDLAEQKNLAILFGVGFSAKISRSTRLNAEWYPRLTDRGNITFQGSKTFDHIGVGFDIETGGHVFQFMLTNSNAMLEQQFLTQTTTSWADLGIRLGFNISRTYSFNNEIKKTW